MMSQQQEDVGPPVDELPDRRDLDWTILKALLEANNRTSQAMESHLLRVCYDECGDSQRTVESVDRAITRHERIIEDLELARKMIDRR